MTRTLILCLCLAGCADWPEASRTPTLQEAGAWPRLVPTADLFATLPEARGDQGQSLSARAAALRARAAILRRSAGSQDEIEAIRARLGR